MTTTTHPNTAVTEIRSAGTTSYLLFLNEIVHEDGTVTYHVFDNADSRHDRSSLADALDLFAGLCDPEDYDTDAEGRAYWEEQRDLALGLADLSRTESLRDATIRWATTTPVLTPTQMSAAIDEAFDQGDKATLKPEIISQIRDTNGVATATLLRIDGCEYHRETWSILSGTGIETYATEDEAFAEWRPLVNDAVIDAIECIGCEG